MTKNNHDEIDKCPDAEASHGDKHENACTDFLGVESMDSENPKKVAKECCCWKALGASFDLITSCHSDKITTRIDI